MSAKHVVLGLMEPDGTWNTRGLECSCGFCSSTGMPERDAANMLLHLREVKIKTETTP